MTLEKVGGESGEGSPWTLRRDDGTPTANYGEHIVCNEGTVILPSPQQNAAVAVSTLTGRVAIVTATGSVESQSEIRHESGNPLILVSDGQDWYVANDKGYAIDPPPKLMDNFEDASATPSGVYESGDTLGTFYTGDTGKFTRTTTYAIEGSTALQVDASEDGNYHLVSEEGDGLPYYPSSGDVIEFYHRAGPEGGGGNSNLGVVFNAELDSNNDVNGYAVYPRTGNDFVKLDVIETDSHTTIDLMNVSLPVDSWIMLRVKIPGKEGVLEHAVYSVDSNGNETGLKEYSRVREDRYKDNTGVGWWAAKRLNGLADGLTRTDSI